MNNKQLQTKRQTKTGFRKIHAKVTSGRRKQRVSAAANADMLDSDVPNASIARALFVILVLHVVAIAVIYVGIKWNKEGFDVDVSSTSESSKSASTQVDQSRVNAQLSVAYAVAGDTYESFAARHNVNVNELRLVNNNVALKSGMVVSLPAQKIKAMEVGSAKATPVSERPPLPDTQNVVQVQPAVVKVTPRTDVNLAVPKAIVVEEAPKAVVVAEGLTYKVQPGDSVWRISRKYGVSQDTLMQLNGMTDPGQLRSGVILKIPAK